MALDHLRKTTSLKLINNTTWSRRSVSAKTTKTNIMDMFKNASAYSPHDPLDADKFKSTVVFQPYITMYTKIKNYFEKGVKHRVEQMNIQTPEEIKFFYENRMLAIRLCEEQMHLIQRHQVYTKDFPESQAWDLLFDMFMYQRQLFAELVVEGVPDILRSTERGQPFSQRDVQANIMGLGQRLTTGGPRYVPPHRR
jgi:hypothetical protein